MAYCTICGSQLEPNAKFCVICGAKLAAAPAATPTQPAQPAAPAQPDETQAPPQATYPPVSGAYQTPPTEQQTPPPPQQPSYSPVPQQTFNNQQQTPPTAEGYDLQDVQNNRIMAVLAYIGWLILIPLFARRDSPFTRFHCNQGLILALAWLGIVVLRGILVGSLDLQLGFLFSLLSLAVVVFSVIGIVNAVQGQAKELPLIGSLRILK
ncbi:MAG: zinc ribbon domain-containing protein [Clostridia bacterium]|nr:zinc ribbon domain-containing protein [Clostridia bacterium]